MATKPLVAILMGSESDRAAMQQTAQILQEFNVPYELKALSAHRLPDKVSQYAQDAETKGIEVIIAGAGMAAHLAGALAANCTLPVIGVPLSGGSLKGLDALLATVQMPSGVPVATVAIDGSKNAAILALQILGRKYPEINKKLKEYRAKSRASLLKKI